MLLFKIKAKLKATKQNRMNKVRHDFKKKKTTQQNDNQNRETDSFIVSKQQQVKLYKKDEFTIQKSPCRNNLQGTVSYFLKSKLWQCQKSEMKGNMHEHHHISR